MGRLAVLGALKVLDGAVPPLASALAEWLWFRPERHPRPDHEVRVLRAGREERIPMGLNALSAWTWGAGPTVLLVHGWSGRGSQLGAFVGPLVDAGFRVVAFDAPGHGDSDGDQSSLFAFADAIDAAARRFGPVHGVVAHSLGAAATALAVSGGLRVQRLVFVAPADPGQAIPRFAAQLGVSQATAGSLEQAIVRRFGLPIETVSAATLAPEIDAPLLVVHDADDRWVPPIDGRVYVDGAAGTWVETEGLGHHRVLRDDRVVAHAVDWLRHDVADLPTRRVPPAVLTKSWWGFDLQFDPPQITDEELAEELSFGR